MSAPKNYKVSYYPNMDKELEGLDFEGLLNHFALLGWVVKTVTFMGYNDLFDDNSLLVVFER